MPSAGLIAGLNILVVEDEFFLADDIGQALAEHGATIVGPVATLDRARHMVQTRAVDFGVLDINLRGEMVFALAEDLQARAIPYIFVTGYDMASVPEQYRDAIRLQKPFSERQVINAITASIA